MKNLIITLFFFANLNIILSCSNTLSNGDKSMFCGSNSSILLIDDMLTINNASEKHTESDFMNSLLQDYNAQTILTSLVALNEFHFLFSDTINLATVINQGYQIDFLSLHGQNVLSKLANYLDTIERELAIEKYNHIQSWCSVYQVMMFIFEQIRQGEDDDFNDIGTIMEEMDETQYILRNKYIEIEGQSYESLSTSQQSSFLIDVVTSISSLSPKKRIIFMNKFLYLLSK